MSESHADAGNLALLLQGLPAEQQNNKVFAATLSMLRQQRDGNADMIVKLSVELMSLRDQMGQLNAITVGLQELHEKRRISVLDIGEQLSNCLLGVNEDDEAMALMVKSINRVLGRLMELTNVWHNVA